MSSDGAGQGSGRMMPGNENEILRFAGHPSWEQKSAKPDALNMEIIRSGTFYSSYM